MRLNKSLQSKVNFTNFCNREKLDPLGAAEFIALVKRCANVGTRWCNGEIDRGPYDKAMRKVEEKAVEIGLRIEDWPGLYPTIKGKDGFDIYLPE